VNYRRFGSTDLLCSEIGLGCQSIGGGLFNDESSAERILHKAFDGGINFYDSSDHYSMGRSEELLGKAFLRDRHDIVIATKVGTRYDAARVMALRMRRLASPLSNLLLPFRKRLHRFRAGGRGQDFCPSYVVNAVESSLRRLQTDYLDILQLHKPPPGALRDEELIRTLERLKQDGKIRHIGVAATSNADAALSLELPWVSSVQITFSLVEQTAREDLPLNQSLGKAILARNPRGFGMLTDLGRDLTAEDYTWDEEEADRLRSMAQAFRFLAGPKRSLATAAIKYVLQQPGITVALPRATSPEDLDDILAASEARELTTEEMSRIDDTWRASCKGLRKYGYRSGAAVSP
jgi:aryl-alcohol dehydrogenase-like predicted oxidoreductase